jgi:hypothetical protein
VSGHPNNEWSDMGLDTSHDCWHGAYSAFTRWRDRLAGVAGYELAMLKDEHRETILIDWGHIVEKNYQGQWDEMPADPLILLIAHSDCDGEILPEHAGPLADRLAELLPLLPDEDAGGHIGNWREKTQKFIDGLRLAAERGEPVEFG